MRLPKDSVSLLKNPRGEKYAMPREKKADKQIRAIAVAQRMNEHYPEAECALHYTTPYAYHCCLLSAQTTDAGVNKVTPLLFERYGTPEAMAQAQPH